MDENDEIAVLNDTADGEMSVVEGFAPVDPSIIHHSVVLANNVRFIGFDALKLLY